MSNLHVCVVCLKEFDFSVLVCPRCGYEIQFHFGGEIDKGKETYEIEEYRRALLGSVDKINLITYRYNLTSQGQIEEPEIEEAILLYPRKGTDNLLHWCEKEFLSIPEEREAELMFKVEKGDKCSYKTIRAKLPAIRSIVKIGVQIGEDSGLRVFIGNNVAIKGEIAPVQVAVLQDWMFVE